MGGMNPFPIVRLLRTNNDQINRRGRISRADERRSGLLRTTGRRTDQRDRLLRDSDLVDR
jgi:hypothetical protein